MKHLAGHIAVIALIASLWSVAVPANATAGCYGKKFKGRHCAAVHYVVDAESYADAPKRIQEELSVFYGLALKEKLAAPKVETNKFNIHTSNSDGEQRLSVDGWVLYEMKNPKQAKKFMKAVNDLGYETMQHEQRPGCGPKILQQ